MKTSLIRLVFFFITIHFTHAQVADSLNVGQFYDEMIESSQTFKQYKVIKKTDLTVFKSKLEDTLQISQSQLNGLKKELTESTRQKSESDLKVTSLSEQLSESEALNDSTAFIGIQISKSSYNIMVWSIIFLLIGGVIALFLGMQNLKKSTAVAKKELEEVNNEYKEYKTSSFQKETKLRRDLQTALNKIEEGKSRF